MYDLILRDATIISSGGRQVADIAIEGGKIAAVGLVRGHAKDEVQGIGKFVIPGIIDTQVRVSVQPEATAEDWASQTRAAVAGGVTSVVELPDGSAATAPALEARAAAAREGSRCNHGRWVQAEGDPAALMELVDAGLALAPLARLDQAEGPDLDALGALVAAAAGRLVGVHAEDARHFASEGPLHTRRPPQSALEAARAVLALAQDNPDSALHLTSLSTSAELSLLDLYRGDLGLTTAVSPPHLFLSVNTNLKKLGPALACDPPVRPELDRRALWAAMKRGRIDVACSRHMPHLRASKDAGAVGMPGIGLFFPLLMSAVKHGRMSLERVVEVCCEAPARIFGLEGKGRIEEGADADLVVMVEGRTERLTGPTAWCASDWTPYVGREAGVAPPLVVVGGQVAARDGVVADSASGASALRSAVG